jgi:phosphatidylserine/phosphatidylglycerophosphate/cardiolipin synthase-like enzyme
MEVVAYQLFIIITIVATRFLKEEWLTKICILWTLETLILLFYPPLIIIQLGVIWVTRHFLIRDSKQQVKINELESLISNQPSKIKEKIRDIPESQMIILEGKAHRDFLMKSIQDAKTSVTILSGWVTRHAFDYQLSQIIELAIRRGVIFQIGYGFQSSKGKHEPFESSHEAINTFKIFSTKYPKNFKFAEFPNHEKILVKDDEFVVYGSNNWLSNKKFKNSERSIVINNTRLAILENKRIYKIIVNKVRF